MPIGNETRLSEAEAKDAVRILAEEAQMKAFKRSRMEPDSFAKHARQPNHSISRSATRHPERWNRTPGFVPSPRAMHNQLRGCVLREETVAGQTVHNVYRANKYQEPKQKGSRILPAVGRMGDR